MEISSVDFSTEDTYDALTMNRHSWSGETYTPSVGDKIDGSIVWTSDFTVQGRGWKICSEINLAVIKAAKCPPMYTVSGLDGSPTGRVYMGRYLRSTTIKATEMHDYRPIYFSIQAPHGQRCGCG